MIKPIQGYVIVEVIKPSEKKGVGGLQKTEKTNSVPQMGKIVSSATTLKTGLIVYFKKWADEEVEYEGKKYSIIEEKEIIAYET